jgi:hypothetical protein
MWMAETRPAVPTGRHGGHDEAAPTSSGVSDAQVNTEQRRLSVPVESGLAAGLDSSPVLAEWFIGCDESFGRRDPDGLRGYAQRLVGSRGTTGQEVVRQWLVIDWLIRHAVTRWLSAAGLAEHAEHLHVAPPVMDRRTLTDIAEPVLGAARAAQTAHEQAWSAVARLAQPDLDQSERRPPWRPVPGNTDPRRVQAWGGLADGTRAAVPSPGRLVGPACRATGYGHAASTDAPAAWNAATRAMREAAGVVAWTATQYLVSGPGWSWHTSADDAWQLAHEVARPALRRVEDEFMASAYELVEEMFRVTEGDGVPAAARRRTP